MSNYYWIFKKALDSDLVEIDKESLINDIEGNHAGKKVEGNLMPDHVFIINNEIIMIFSGRLTDILNNEDGNIDVDNNDSRPISY